MGIFILSVLHEEMKKIIEKITNEIGYNKISLDIFIFAL